MTRPKLTTTALRALGSFAWETLTGRWRHVSDRPMPSAVPADFLGICVAANSRQAGDDYIINRLRDLGLKHVRLDFTYPSAGGQQARLLDKLLQENFKVCLHLVQPRSEALLISRQKGQTSDAALERWSLFVEETLERWNSLESIEVGATCNRRKWSGQSLNAFLQTWQTAWSLAQSKNIKIIGPNVTDFEPPYNYLLLSWMKRANCLPVAHTNNLFAERATEPENFDHKILGYRAAKLIRYNTVRKARLLQTIGELHGVPALISPHVAWSLRRIARFLDHTEEKQADYLSRYILLAAAGGALQRVYWGPLIGQREGLIDDGTDDYPDPPHVTLYPQAAGKPEDYRLRPAFHSLKAVNHYLKDIKFVKACSSNQKLEILAFEKTDGTLCHAAWTMNGFCAATTDCYTSQALASASWTDRNGNPLVKQPQLLTESPVYLTWKQPPENLILENPKPLNLRLARHTQQAKTAPIQTERWQGAYLTQTPDEREIKLSDLTKLTRHDTSDLLRVGRNQVWRVPAPWDSTQALVVKRFQIPNRWRRLLNYGKPSKAVRSWNGAQELLRRGILTPAPIACFTQKSPILPAYYICENFPADGSVRDIFTPLATGADLVCQISAAEWYNLIAEFLVNLHDRGVFFRDLSAGNLLFCRQNDKIAFSLIDTARARFYPWVLPLRQRLSDLTRICHPLHRKGRRRFLATYMNILGKKTQFWMFCSLWLYDRKHNLKNAIKPLRKRSRSIK